MTLEEHRTKADALLARHRLAAAQAQAEEKALAAARQRCEDCEQAQQALQEIAQHVQHQAHERLAGVVTHCLRAVFGEGAYEFKILFEKKRGKTEARLVFTRDGEQYDPADASGGGAVDVAAFALRLACLLSSKPRLRRLLVLDEPFRFLSAGYRERVCDTLLAVAKEMGVQIIMVTHAPELEVGKVIQL